MYNDNCTDMNVPSSNNGRKITTKKNIRRKDITDERFQISVGAERGGRSIVSLLATETFSLRTK